MKLVSFIFIISIIGLIHHFRDLDKKRCDQSNGIMEYNLFTGDICHMNKSSN